MGKPKPTNALYDVLTLAEFCSTYRVSDRKARREISTGNLRAHRLGSGANAPLRIRRIDAEAWFAALPTRTPASPRRRAEAMAAAIEASDPAAFIDAADTDATTTTPQQSHRLNRRAVEARGSVAR